MLGAAGCIAPEILGKSGLIPEATNIEWFRTGVYPPAGVPKDLYWTDPFSLFWIEVIAVQFAELKRWQDFRYGARGAVSSIEWARSAYTGFRVAHIMLTCPRMYTT